MIRYDCKYLSTTSSLEGSGFSLWSAVASAVEENVMESPPKYTLQIKACPIYEGAAVGFCFFESGVSEKPHGGGVFFRLKRTMFEAYYSAILACLDYVNSQQGIKSVTVQCDHEMVVHQLNGKYEIQRDSLRDLYRKIMDLKESRFDDVRFEFITSSENVYAGHYAQRALEQKSMDDLESYLKDPMATVEDPTDGDMSEEVNQSAENVDQFHLNSTDNPETISVENSPQNSVALSIHPDHIYILEFDGGSRGNPKGVAGSGMVLYDSGPNGNEKLETWAGWDYLGLGEVTSNQAEYSGLIAGLEMALKQGIRKIAVYGDSQLIIKQMKGEYQVKNEGLKPLWKKTNELLEKFDSVSLHHIPRNLNQRADSLANFAMDSRNSGSSDQIRDEA